MVRAVRVDEAAQLYRVRPRSLAEDPDAFDQTVADAEAEGPQPWVELLASGAWAEL
jgi:hypothetical protein